MRVDENMTKLYVGNYNKKYKIKIIYNSAIYIKKSIS